MSTVTQGEHNARVNPKQNWSHTIRLKKDYPGFHGVIVTNYPYTLRMYDPQEIDPQFPVASVLVESFSEEENKLSLKLLSSKFPHTEAWEKLYNHETIMVELIPNNLSLPHSKFYAELITDSCGKVELIITYHEID